MSIRSSIMRILSVFLIGAWCAQAFGYHDDLASAFQKSIGPGQKLAGRDGVLVFAVLPAEAFSFEKWDSVNATREDGAIKRDMRPAHCIPGVCIYVAKLDAGTYQLRQIDYARYISVPLQGLGAFKIEPGKITNLGLFGVVMIKGKDDDFYSTRNFDYGLHVDYMAPQDEDYVHRAIARILPDVNPGSGIIRWNEGGGFTRRLDMKDRTRTIFQEFDRVVAGSDDSLYFLTALGELVKFDKSGDYQELKTGSRLLSYHSLYLTDDFYLMGAGAGRLNLWKPGRQDFESTLDFGIDKVVLDVVSGGGKFYALVSGGKDGIAAYRFDSIDAKTFEKVAALQTGKKDKTANANRDTGDIEGYISQVTPQGVYMKPGKKDLVRFDPATEKFVRISTPRDHSIFRFLVRDDGSILIITEPAQKTLTPSSALENSESAYFKEEAGKKKTRSKGMATMYGSALLSSSDGRKWERLALLNGRTMGNIYFSDAATAYLVLERQVYSAEKKKADYVRAQLYKSVDGGKTWIQSGSMDTIGYSYDMELRRHGKGLALIDKNAARLHITEDEGKTWTKHDLYDSIVRSEKGKKSK